jgi:hypothetical protein
MEDGDFEDIDISDQTLEADKDAASATDNEPGLDPSAEDEPGPTLQDECDFGIVCGVVLNLTNNPIRIEGDVNGQVVQATLGPGRDSRSIMRDVDRFTFPGTGFWVGGFHHPKGKWIRIVNGMRVTCTKVPPFEPTCAVGF